MLQEIKNKIADLIQQNKNNPKVKRMFKLLLTCIVTVIVYVVVARLNLGIVGLVIRIICMAVLVYILYQIQKHD